MSFYHSVEQKIQHIHVTCLLILFGKNIFSPIEVALSITYKYNPFSISWIGLHFSDDARNNTVVINMPSSFFGFIILFLYKLHKCKGEEY